MKKAILYKFADFGMNYGKLLLTVFFFVVTGSFSLQAQTAFDKQAFYTAIASGSPASWNKQLALLKNLKGNDRAAFEGALLMRKAGGLKIPAQKLSTFKQGHKLLERAISKEPQNLEYRFLRLLIQENAPKILNYNKDIATDSRLIKQGFKSLPAVLQTVISDYSKTSKALPTVI